MRYALLLLGPLAACQPVGDCAELGPAAGLSTAAALLRIDLYAPPARCLGSKVDPGGTTPLRSLSAAPAALGPISLPAGAVVAHLRAYSDAAGTALLGEGCSSAVVRAGQSACLALPVVASPDGGGDGGCQLLSHSNGVGQSYLDCAPLGAPDQLQRLALAACTAATGDGATCRDLTCSGGAGYRAVCAHGERCTCWTLSGPGAGHVHVSSGGGCDCATTGDPAWN